MRCVIAWFHGNGRHLPEFDFRFCNIFHASAYLVGFLEHFFPALTWLNFAANFFFVLPLGFGFATFGSNVLHWNTQNFTTISQTKWYVTIFISHRVPNDEAYAIIFCWNRSVQAFRLICGEYLFLEELWEYYEFSNGRLRHMKNCYSLHIFHNMTTVRYLGVFFLTVLGNGG